METVSVSYSGTVIMFDVLNLGALIYFHICAMAVTFYTMKQMQKEWVKLFATRRVYYLQADHWADRREKLH